MEIKGIAKPIQGNRLSKQKLTVSKNGVYALAHYVPAPLSYPNRPDKYDDHKAHQGSLLMDYSRKVEVLVEGKKRRDLILIGMNNFDSPCIGVQDFEPKSARYKFSFIFLKNRSSWLQIFRDQMEESISDSVTEFTHPNAKKRKKEATTEENVPFEPVDGLNMGSSSGSE